MMRNSVCSNGMQVSSSGNTLLVNGKSYHLPNPIFMISVRNKTIIVNGSIWTPPAETDLLHFTRKWELIGVEYMTIRGATRVDLVSGPEFKAQCQIKAKGETESSAFSGLIDEDGTLDLLALNLNSAVVTITIPNKSGTIVLDEISRGVRAPKGGLWPSLTLKLCGCGRSIFSDVRLQHFSAMNTTLTFNTIRSESFAYSGMNDNLEMTTGEITDPVVISTMNGNVHLEDMKFSTLSVGTMNGNVTLKKLRGRTFNVKSMNGNLRGSGPPVAFKSMNGVNAYTVLL